MVMPKEKLSKDEINQAYQEILGRNADPTGLESYAGFSKGDLEKSLKKSKEFKDSGRTKQDVERARMQNDLKTQSNITTTKGVEKGSYFTLAEGVKPDDRAYEVGELPDGTKLYVKGDKQTSGLEGKLGVDKIIGKDVYKVAGQVGGFVPGWNIVGDEAAAIAGGTRGAAAYSQGMKDVWGEKFAKIYVDAGDIVTKVGAGLAAPATGGLTLVGEQALDITQRKSLNQKVDWGDEAIRLGVNLVSANLGRWMGGAEGGYTHAALAGGVQAAGGFALGDDLEDVLLSSSLAALSAKMSGPAKAQQTPADVAMSPGNTPGASGAMIETQTPADVIMTPGNTPATTEVAASPGGAASVSANEFAGSNLETDIAEMVRRDPIRSLPKDAQYAYKTADGRIFSVTGDQIKGIALQEGDSLHAVIGSGDSRALAPLNSNAVNPSAVKDPGIAEILAKGDKDQLNFMKLSLGTSVVTMLGTAGVQMMGIQKQDEIARRQLDQEKELFYAGLDAESGYMNASFAASAGGEATQSQGGAPAAIW